MLQNFLGAFGTSLNGITAIILATTFGFGALPSALLFATGAIAMLVTGEVSPLMLQTELVVLAGSLGRDRSERLSICVYAGLFSAVLGATGIVGAVVDFVGSDILFGIMAGVGIMLTTVGVKMIGEDLILGLPSLFSGVFTYLLTKDVIYTSIVSILVPGVLYNVLKRCGVKCGKNSAPALNEAETERFRPVKLRFNAVVLRGFLAIATLLTGGIISGAAVNASLAGRTAGFNAVTLYTGLGTALSSFFGGAPGGIVVSGTAVAPDPVVSGVIMMAILFLVMVFRLTGKLRRILPLNCVSGLLFVIGAFVIFPGNALSALGTNPLTGAVTMLTAALVDPFTGMCAGLAVRRFLLML